MSQLRKNWLKALNIDTYVRGKNFGSNYRPYKRSADKKHYKPNPCYMANAYIKVIDINQVTCKNCLKKNNIIQKDVSGYSYEDSLKLK